MTLLILGLALWVGAHLFKRLVPSVRASMGEKGKVPIALILVVSVVLMVIGYRSAEGAIYWGRTPAMTGINNLLMLLAFYVYSVGATPPGRPRVWLGTKLRHPQLTGFSIFAVAHLLVNGDVPSFVLFGGLLVWALIEIVLINAQEGRWTPPAQAPARKEALIAGVAVVILAVVMLIHNWLGVQPWG